MATEKQIAANRRNALKSTGPKTPRGKLFSSRNALTHGLAASRHVILEEDDAEFCAIRDALIEEHQPVGATEFAYLRAMTRAEWLRRRISRLDTALVDQAMQSAWDRRRIDPFPTDPDPEDKASWNDRAFLDQRATRLLGEAWPKIDMRCLSLAHYDAHFSRDFTLSLLGLLRLQQRRSPRGVDSGTLLVNGKRNPDA